MNTDINSQVIFDLTNTDTSSENEFSKYAESTNFEDFGPSDEELLSVESELQVKLARLNKLLASNPELAVLWDENKRLRHLLAKQEARLATIMREKSEIIKICNANEKELKKHWKEFYKGKSNHA